MIPPRNISSRWNDLEQYFSSQLSQANISPNWYIVRYMNVYYNHEPIKIMFNMWVVEFLSDISFDANLGSRLDGKSLMGCSIP
jgi:hypothetical protein